jgi:hypothetical protein
VPCFSNCSLSLILSNQYILLSIIRYWRKGIRKVRSKGGRGIGHKQLQRDVRGKRGYWTLKVAALCRTVRRTFFERGYISVVRQTRCMIVLLMPCLPVDATCVAYREDRGIF